VRQGLYESLINGQIRAELNRLTDVEVHAEGLDDADSPHILSRYVAQLLEQHLEGVRSPIERLRLVNQLERGIEKSLPLQPSVR